jgi:predicted transcriptional regulator of viral defense system
MLTTGKALSMGVHPETLYGMRDAGLLERVGRGIFRLPGLPPLAEPDLVTVALRAPRGVLCLVSALALHDMTTQVPHEVHLALRPGAEAPRLEHPPLRVFRFGGASFSAGVRRREVDGVPLRVYDPAKTVADCFKFRNKVGLDVALEALRAYARRRGATADEVLKYARVCRVERIMRPYLEAIL